MGTPTPPAQTAPAPDDDGLDFLDAVVDLDARWYEEGRAEGAAAGRARGREEGVAVGCVLGWEWEGLGSRMDVMVVAWGGC